MNAIYIAEGTMKKADVPTLVFFYNVEAKCSIACLPSM
jgi:hypothetical protein